MGIKKIQHTQITSKLKNFICCQEVRGTLVNIYIRVGLNEEDNKTELQV